MRHQAIIGLVCGVVGCSGEARVERVDPGSNALGIEVIEIDRGDLLRGRGPDRHGDEVAQASYREGRVLYASDGAEPEWMEGTELILAVGDERFADVSPDALPHVLPVTLAPRLAELSR